jgi:FlaA1/EpsC-like NDP-sugar epimerase
VSEQRGRVVAAAPASTRPAPGLDGLPSRAASGGLSPYRLHSDSDGQLILPVRPAPRGWRRYLLRNTRYRQAVVLALDATIAAVAVWVAMLLRFDGAVPEAYRHTLLPLAGLLAGSRFAVNFTFRLHLWSFRLSGLADATRVVAAGAVGSMLALGVIYFGRPWLAGLIDPLPPRSVIALEFFITTACMGLVRYSPRLANVLLGERQRARQSGNVQTIIVGAGAAGEMLLRDLQRSRKHGHQVVGFVDDNRHKWGMIVGGKSVLGPIEALPRLATELHVEEVLIAIPQLAATRLRQILNLCAESHLRFNMLPVSFLDHQERGAAAMLRTLTPEDLLPRPAVRFGVDADAVKLASRRVMVTGAGGSIGSELCRQLLGGGVRSLAMVDINENELYLLSLRLRRAHPDAEITAEVADLRDDGHMRVLLAALLPHDVFHAAAHKHVPLMESAPCEAVKNNILATAALARLADQAGVERFVLISTDKAVRPTSVMGASKRVAEMVVRQMARRSRTRFTAVRFGNVLASSGSVVPIFREQISSGTPVTVTHPDVRRYFMTIDEAVGLVLRAAYGDYGELCVLDMGEQIRIADLARHMITMAGLVPDVDVPIVYTGLRPGEKIHEELLTEDEERTSRVSDRIFSADCPAPPEDLDVTLAALAAAARSESPTEVLRLLHELVPSYAAPATVTQ